MRIRTACQLARRFSRADILIGMGYMRFGQLPSSQDYRPTRKFFQNIYGTPGTFVECLVNGILGWQDRFQWPTRRGFLEFIGCLGGHINSYGTRQSGLPYADGSLGHDHNGMHDLQWNEVPLYSGEYSTSLFRDAAVRFIDRHSNRPKPFFLYVPFNAPHGPFAAPRASVQAAVDSEDFDASLLRSLETHAGVLSATEKNGVTDLATAKLLYAAMTLSVDEAVESIYTKLESTGVSNNTLFILASDNGVSYIRGVPVGSSYPLRGQKGSPYEGGTRVANFVVWPGRVSPGQRIGSPVWIGDLAPTFLELAGAKLPDNFDGSSLLPAIDTNAPIIRPYGARRIMPMLTKFRYSDKNRPEIAMLGRATVVTIWRKYIRTVYWNASGRRLPMVDEELYDLHDDIGETRNLIYVSSYRPFVKQARQEFEAFGGQQLFEELPYIPSEGVWGGFVPTLEFGFTNGTPALETTVTP